MKSRFYQLLKYSLFGMVVTVIPVLSNAADSTVTMGGNSVTVNYADLDLSKAEGARALYQRLKNAANLVCGVRTGISDRLDVVMVKNKCVRAAMADAIRDIHSDQLDALYYKGENSRQKS